MKRRYDVVRAELALPDDELVDLNWQAYNRLHNHVIVLVKDIDRRLVRALQYAKTLRADTAEAIFVDVTGEEAEAFRKRWEKAEMGIRLNVIESPYREVIAPLLDYVRNIPRPDQGPRRHGHPAGVRADERRRRDAARPDVVLDQAAALRGGGRHRRRRAVPPDFDDEPEQVVKSERAPKG